MLDAIRRNELETRGFTYLRGVVARDVAADIEAQIWAVLAGRGIDPFDRATWPKPGPVSGLQALRKSDAFAAFTNERTRSLGDSLLGAGTWATGRGQALVSFPDVAPWQLPRKSWHFDMPARGPADRWMAVRMLGIVADLAPHGGGTLIVEGSHELVRRMVSASSKGDVGQSADVRRQLCDRSPWFAALLREGAEPIATFMQDGEEIDGVRVRVIETTGAAGDLCAMHPWMLHNGAMNCSDRPRMMMTQTFLHRDHPY